MITKFRAENYGCLKEVEVPLSPIHAFIGPNDSGKSTLLHAMRTLVQAAGGEFNWSSDGTPFPFEPWLLPKPGVPEVFLGAYTQAGWYAVTCGERGIAERAQDAASGEPYVDAARLLNVPGILHRSNEERIHTILDELRRVRLLRFDPDALRAPSGLIPETTKIGFLDERGRGLPGIYFALLNRGDDSFSAISEDVRRLFPTIKSIRLKPVTTATLVLEAELQNGVKFGAERMSEGLLYYLAFAALRYLDPASLILIEEPENGLYPARIAEVIKMLRTIVAETGTQIVMATHSPLVVNELEPDEVTLVTRPSLEAGTQLTPIRETHNFEKRRSVYELGELWLAYADGIEEAPLFDARRR